MNGIINKNQLTNVNKYQFDKPLIHKKDSIIDNCIRECHDKYFHSFENRCLYSINSTNIAKKEKTDLPVPDKSMGSYEINEK